MMSSRASIIQEQNVEYITSSYQDLLKDLGNLQSTLSETLENIIQNRASQRALIDRLLETKAIDILSTAEINKILRIPTRLRTPKDIEILSQYQSRAQESTTECFNEFKEQEVRKRQEETFKFIIPNINKTICVNMNYILLSGSFFDDTRHSFVNAFINLPLSGEKYLYPLNEEDSNEFITKAVITFKSYDSFKQKLYPELHELNNSIARDKRDISSMESKYSYLR